MSGHSKWSTIKRQKGSADAKRGQTFTKLSNAITIAVKQGGGVGDPSSNFKLRLAVDRARAANMPKENIERAISRAKGAADTELMELLYEGFAPGGVAVMVEAATDNKSRTVSLVKNIFEKSGGTLGSSGTVAYLFERKGVITVKKSSISDEDVLNLGIEIDAQDIEEEGDSIFYYIFPDTLQLAKNILESRSAQIESAELSYIPKNYMHIGAEDSNSVVALLEKLEELDDVQQVYNNLEIID